MRKSTIRRIKEYAIGLLGVCVIFGGMLIGGYIENHYSMECVVKEYNGELVAVDEVGERWCDDRLSGFEVGDVVRVTFNTNTTDNTRYDDIICKIK